MADACSSVTGERRRGGPATTRATAATVAVQLAVSVEVGSVLIATVAGRLLLREATSWPRSPTKRDAVIVRFRNRTTQILPLRGKLG
jgi:hypothetical protein